MHEQITPSAKIVLAASAIKNAGRGVFAATFINSGEIIETCPILETLVHDYGYLKQTKLRDYYFMWESNNRAVICLGFGSLYNHSYAPNATYQKNLADKTITFVATKCIYSGEEVTVNYNYGNPDDKSKLWIDDIPDYQQTTNQA